MNDVMTCIDELYSKNICYRDTDSIKIHEKDWNKLVEGSFIKDCLWYGKNDYGDGGILKALFLGPKIKYRLVIDDSGLLSEKTSFKGYDNGRLNITYDISVNLLGGGVVTNEIKKLCIIKLDGTKIRHKEQNCDRCDNIKKCKKCVDKPVVNCFECEKIGVCKSCFDLVVDKKYVQAVVTL